MIWGRAISIDGAHFWGTSGLLNGDDVNQGAASDCYLLAAAEAIAEKPERLQKIFLNQDNDLNEAGIYGVNFYTLGVKHTVIVDDYLPLTEWGTLKYANAGKDKDNAMWMPILEKAFAKLNGNYKHIDHGQPDAAAS